MLKADKVKILGHLEDTLGIYLHDFIDVDENTLLVKSHFFDFTFGPNSVKVVDSYNLPGPTLQEHINETLPYTLEYTHNNFLNVFLETLDDIHTRCISCELIDEENFDENNE